MKTLFKLLALSVVGQALIFPLDAAEKSDRSGSSGQTRGSSQTRSSGSYSSYGTQRQVQRSQPSRQIAPRQISQPSFRQPMIAPPSRQTINRVPQLSRNDLSPRVTTMQNPVLPRRTQLPQSRPMANQSFGKATYSTQPLSPPAKSGIAQRAAIPSSGKSLVLPGNRPMISSSAKNVLPSPARYQTSGPRVKDSHPAVVRPGQNSIAARRPDFQKAGATWATNGNTRTANVSRNFRNGTNWSTRCQDWGGSPWWNRSCVRPWYGGCWNGNWCSSYYSNYCWSDPWYRSYLLPGYVSYDSYYPVGWGLLGWSLGSMVYDIGYETYSNPYSLGTDATYNEPLARVVPAPLDDSRAQEITRNSESFIADSQVAFKAQNYLVALELASKAVAAAPGDGALHEYRALVLFALGRYGEAAGVLHPVIASGPGWDWSTMRALYDSHDTYTNQLRRLETYVRENPAAADARFLLGYHYMICGHLDSATTQFDSAAQLKPADNVSNQLAKLAQFSARKDSDNPLPPGVERTPAPAKSLPREIVSLEKLQGTWISNRDAGATITLQFLPDGKFTWTYLKDAKTTELAGAYSINDNGLLVLDSPDSQMVANVSLPAERQLKFVLVGGPPADPGLEFKKP